MGFLILRECIVPLVLFEAHLDLCLEAGLLLRCFIRDKQTFRYHGLPKVVMRVLGIIQLLYLHCNFSNEKMRNQGGKNYIESICNALEKNHDKHIKEYGSANEQRLTGLHETQSIDKFSYGLSDRGASIRIPISMPSSDWKGYLEDRRPASNADPYRIVSVMIDTVNEANV